MKSRVEADFHDAIDRIVSGAPNHPMLQENQQAGKLRLTIKSVAMEAGRSRTLIGTKNCVYPAVRSRILAISEEGPKVQQTREALRHATERVRHLNEAIAESATREAALLMELRALRMASGTNMFRRAHNNAPKGGSKGSS